MTETKNPLPENGGGFFCFWPMASVLLAEDVENLLGGGFGVDFCDNMGYCMVVVGYESGAHKSHIFAATHFLHLPYAESFADLAADICQQGERQVCLAANFR